MQLKNNCEIVNMNEYIIDEKLSGTRLDKCATVLDKEISRMTVQRLIEEGNIIVNGKKTKASYKVNTYDKISINKPEAKEINLEAQDIPIDILYEDKDIIVVNKPKGMVVHPANRKPRWHTCKCNNEYMQEFTFWDWWRNKTTELYID